MSVAQWTPERNRPAAIPIVNAVAKRVTAFLIFGSFERLSAWKENVGMTPVTRSVVEEG